MWLKKERELKGRKLPKNVGKIREREEVIGKVGKIGTREEEGVERVRDWGKRGRARGSEGKPKAAGKLGKYGVRERDNEIGRECGMGVAQK